MAINAWDHRLKLATLWTYLQIIVFALVLGAYRRHEGCAGVVSAVHRRLNEPRRI